MPQKRFGSISRLTLFVLILTSGISCNTIKPYVARDFQNWATVDKPEGDPVHSIYLFGDGGDVNFEQTSVVLGVLRKKLLNDPESQNSVIFLGDNIYYRGLPEESQFDREEKEKIIVNQMDAVKNTGARVIFIPGNHDWNFSSPGGLEQVIRQERFVEEYFEGENVFLPDNGCAGPVEVNVNEALTIIVINSEWWLFPFEKPRAPENDCTVEDELDLIVQLEDMIRRNEGKHIVIAAHHPLFSNSNHGGHHNIEDHIFPLRLVRDNLYIPLSLIGSLYPILRKLGAARQDIPNVVYQRYIAGVMSIIRNRGNVVYAAGHDHNLQLKKVGLMYQIISGSGSKLTFAARGFGSTYVHQTIGFARLSYYTNGEAWVEYFGVNADNPEGELTFSTPLYALSPMESPAAADPAEEPDYTDSVKIIAANKSYKASSLKKFFLGSHYRREWIAPVEVPYMDMKTYSGGLTPVEKVGGGQAIKLILTDKDSAQYTLRSVEKFPVSFVSEAFQNTWIEDFVKDQATTSHPYGPLVIPKMAEALEINHADSELYFIPNSPYLGVYMDEFGGMLGLVGKTQKGYNSLGATSAASSFVSTFTMLGRLDSDSNNEVDDVLYLKSRLFDMLIGDWGKADNQWRWGEYEKPGEGSVFRPMPRDRDHVFSRYDGVIPWILSRKWTYRYLSNFDYNINDIKGLNYTARNLDRRVLTKLSRRQWLEIAESVRDQLTDGIIDEAVRQLPKEVYPISGPAIAAKIKSRRNDLAQYAQEYYSILTKEVDIVGSQKEEYFEVHRLNDNETRVLVFNSIKGADNHNKIFDRVFYSDETDEIRLFGLGGDDKIVVSGEVNSGITIRAVGADEDVLIDSSYVSGWGKSTLFHIDENAAKNMHIGKETRVIISRKGHEAGYDRNYFEYDYFGPRLNFGYNVDDGFRLGGGLKLERHGYKNKAVTNTHLLDVKYAFTTQSPTINYHGLFQSAIVPGWDLRVDINSGLPLVFNYFGQGNATESERSIDFYRIRINKFEASTLMMTNLSGAVRLGFGPFYEHFNVEEDETTILGSVFEPADLVNTGRATFSGIKFFSRIAIIDFPVYPEKGFIWQNDAGLYREIYTGNASFARLKTDLLFYVTPNLPVKVTFASRLGASANFGDYYFYQSNFLGNLENLRGYRRTRFAGNSSIYNNNELRLRLINIRSSLFNANFGFFGFFDQGRVSSEQGFSDQFHRSFGPGFYFHVFEILLLSSSYGISKEDQLLTFKMDFLF